MGVVGFALVAATGGGIAAAASSGGGGGGGGETYVDNSAQLQKIKEDTERQQKEREEKIKEQKEKNEAEQAKLREEKENLKKELAEEKEKIEKEGELTEKKRKEEEAQKEREKQEKIKKANEYFQSEKNKYESEKLTQIKNNFDKNNFCQNQSDKLESLIKEQVPKILSNLIPKFQEKIKEVYSEILNNLKQTYIQRKKRILLIGKTGVGKSTLINSIFNSDLAETGFGRPITMNEKPKKYEYNTHDDLILYDSRGIEIDPNYGVEINYNKIKKFINEQFQMNEPLDAIWYCITGTKMEDVEIELVKKLRALYKDNSLSTVIVYTQSFFEEDFIAMKNYLITKIDDQLIIHNIIAKMKKMGNSIIKSFGLEELVSITKKLIEKNSNLVLLSTAKTKTEQKMENLINEKIIISNEINFEAIFEQVISSFIGNNNVITQEIKNLIQTFHSSYDNKCNLIINENLNQIVEKEGKIMTDDLKGLVTDVLLKFDNAISIEQKGFLEENKKKILELLLDLAKECGKNNLNSCSKKLIENEIKNYIKKINKDYISTL